MCLLACDFCPKNGCCRCTMHAKTSHHLCKKVTYTSFIDIAPLTNRMVSRCLTEAETRVPFNRMKPWAGPGLQRGTILKRCKFIPSYLTPVYRVITARQIPVYMYRPEKKKSAEGCSKWWAGIRSHDHAQSGRHGALLRSPQTCLRHVSIYQPTLK